MKPQKQGVKRNTEIDVCRFPVLFWLLKYQEWSWGGGVFGDFCFVLFFDSGGKKIIQALVCDRPPGVVAVQ